MKNLNRGAAYYSKAISEMLDERNNTASIDDSSCSLSWDSQGYHGAHPGHKMTPTQIKKDDIEDVQKSIAEGVIRAYKNEKPTTINKHYLAKILVNMWVKPGDREIACLLYDLSKKNGKVRATDKSIGAMCYEYRSEDSVQYHIANLRKSELIESDGKQNRRKGEDGWYATRRIRFTKKFYKILDAIWRRIQEELLNIKERTKFIKEYINGLHMLDNIKIQQEKQREANKSHRQILKKIRESLKRRFSHSTFINNRESHG
jgi:DNA-binding transcriptional ArsR family regulator